MLHKNITLDEILACPECESPEIKHDEHHGENYCADCGLVIEANLIDEGPDWRNFEPGSNPSRVGNPTNPAYQYASRTIINVKEASDKSLFRRMSKWNERVNNSKDRNVILALTFLAQKASQLELAKPTQEYAATLYRQAAEKNLIRGRSIEGIVGACIYISGRKNKQVQIYDRLADATNQSKKQLGSNIRVLQKELGLPTIINSPEVYIPMFITDLAKNEECCLHEEREVQIMFEGLIFDLAEYFEEKMINIGVPNTAAAAYIYIANKLTNAEITQKEIAAVCDVTEVTIRNRYREFAKVLPKEVQEEYF